MGYVRLGFVLSVVVHMQIATAHLRGRNEQLLGLLQASVESVEVQAEAIGVDRWGESHPNVLALLGGAPGTALIAAHEKLAKLAGHQAPAPGDGPSPASHLLQVFIRTILWAFLVAVIAYFWHGREVVAADPSKSAEGFEDWKFHFCSCFEDPLVCLCSFCCPAIRWAETVSFVPGLLRFWPAFLIFMVFVALAQTFVELALIFVVVLALICTSYRQELRQRFGMEAGGMSYVTDCLLYACCMCCAIAQEARHVEEALRSKHKAVECPEDRKQAN